MASMSMFDTPESEEVFIESHVHHNEPCAEVGTFAVPLHGKIAWIVPIGLVYSFSAAMLLFCRSVSLYWRESPRDCNFATGFLTVMHTILLIMCIAATLALAGYDTTLKVPS